MSSALSVTWAPAADRDLGRAHAYLKERSPRAATRFAKVVLEAIDLLASHPEMGQRVEGPASMPGYRRFPIGNHVLYYRVAGGELIIVRLWDGRQAPESLILPGDE